MAVHPHACGEHHSLEVVGAFYGGSSPRVRGTLQNFLRALYINRFIPTRAGNTQSAAQQ